MEDVWSLWSSLRPWITWAWAWIKANHEPLTVVVTFLGVLVAWRYVVLTRRLAEAANVQAGAAREQAEAGRIAANAAAEQARVTRQIFEAAHRPYLDAGLPDWFFESITNFRLQFHLKNRGPVPAVLVGWSATARHEGATLSERVMNPADGGICIFPERGEDLEFGPGTGGGSVLHPPDGMEVGFAVEYRRFHDTGYVTRLSVRSSHGGFEVTSVDVR